MEFAKRMERLETGIFPNLLNSRRAGWRRENVLST